MRRCPRRARRLRCRMPVEADRPVAEATATNGTERRKARPCAGLFAADNFRVWARNSRHAVRFPLVQVHSILIVRFDFALKSLKTATKKRRELKGNPESSLNGGRHFTMSQMSHRPMSCPRL